jgi:hypothetical protein
MGETKKRPDLQDPKLGFRPVRTIKGQIVGDRRAPVEASLSCGIKRAVYLI